MALLKVNTPFNIDLNFETAPFHRRLFAWIVDIILFVIFLFVIGKIFDKSFSDADVGEYGLSEIFIVAPLLLYHFLCELLLNGQSIGKMLLKIHVVSISGKTPSVSQLLLRWVSRFIDFGLLWSLLFVFSGNTFLSVLLALAGISSFIVYISSAHSQRLGDFVAGTTLVSKKLPYQLEDTIFKDLDMKTYQPVFPSVMRLSDKDINIIDNIVKHNNQSSIENYLTSVAEKIKKALDIETDMTSEMFLETLLRDYNYLSRK